MDYISAVFLGFLQGVTEFLPVSSSGHLVLVESWLNLDASKYLFFDLILHLATLAAVVIFYRGKIARLCSALINWGNTGVLDYSSTPEKRLLSAVFVSTFITSVIALGLYGVNDAMREHEFYVGFGLVYTGIILLLTLLTRSKDMNETNPYPLHFILFALILGLAQGVSSLPGISRSGSTVAAALFLGASRGFALEYSFIMSIPIIVLACVFEMRKGLGSVEIPVAALGFLISFFSGYLFLWLLSWLTKKGRFYLFGFYTIPLGIWILWRG